MAELSGLQVFKYLPAAKKTENSNCKKCGFPTCMAYALKLAKGQTDITLCEFIPDELKSILEHSLKKPQKEIEVGLNIKTKVGGENVMFRHDKTFINKTGFFVAVENNDFKFLERLNKFDITRVGERFRIDGIFARNCSDEFIQKAESFGFSVLFEKDLGKFITVNEKTLPQNIEKLTQIRREAVLNKNEEFSNPVFIHFEKSENLLELASKASFYLCKYANLFIFENFDEALFSTLMTLRQNIYTDPQKPLQVESKIYEFNNPNRDAIVFMTTNFALTYFAVANEIEELNMPAYLIVTPSDGMSVLTAWSAEKFTAQIVAKTVKKFNLAEKINRKRIIIPGLLAHMKEEIEEVLPDFEIVVGSNEAYNIGEFVRGLD